MEVDVIVDVEKTQLERKVKKKKTHLILMSIDKNTWKKETNDLFTIN